MSKNDDSIILTIGIPTYNRCESVAQLLDQLSLIPPTVRSEVLIINNGVEIDIDTQITRLKERGYSVRSYKNLQNCGGQENCIRIYEFAFGKYIWYIGDDDRIYPHSLSVVTQILLQYDPDCLLMNASTPGEMIPTYATGFISDSQVYAGDFMLGRLICAPLAILKRETVVSALSRSRLYLGCFAPQFLLLLMGDIKTYFYLQNPMIHNNDVPVARNQKLSILPIFQGIGHLASVPTSNQKAKWVKRLIKREWRVLTSPQHVLGALAIEGINGGKPDYWTICVASWRNYPFMLAIVFTIILFILKCSPKKLLIPIINWYANTIKKKDINIRDFRSVDRI